MFNEKSAMVRTWVRLIQIGAYTLDQVPALSNLREVVTAVLDE